MRKLLLAFCLLPLFGAAQNTDVLFFNEGYYDAVAGEQVVAPSLGVYNEESEDYYTLDIFGDAQFISDAILSDDAIYVAADDQLLKLDKSDYSILTSTEVTGIRDIAIYQNTLIVSRGHYLFEPDFYVGLYNADDLSLITSLTPNGIDGPAYATEDIIVEDGKAYLCVSNSFSFGDYKSILGVYDLNTSDYSEIDLGTDAVNPEKLFIHEDELLAFCNHNYDKSSIVRVDLETLESEVAYVANNAGCALSAKVDNYIYYQEYSVGSLARFNLTNFEVQDTLETSSFYSVAQHPVTGKLFGAETDYVSTGNANVMNLEGDVENSFSIGVSCGNILFNTQETVGIEEKQVSVAAYPNPSSTGLINIESAEMIESIEVFDLSGKKLKDLQPMNNRVTLQLPEGLYIAKLRSGQGLLSLKLLSK